MIAASSAWHTARLVEADFRSDLDQLTDLSKEDFNNADLSYALLQRTNLLRCCLYGTSFCEADLREADLHGCDLRNSKLEGALLNR